MHFLEAARFPNAPVLVGHKVNFTLRPAKSADTYFTVRNLLYSPQKSAVSADCQVDRVPPPHSVWALKQPLSLSYLLSFA